MTQLVLSTGNVMSGGPSIIRKPGTNRSNLELVNSLRDSFAAAQQDYAGVVPSTNGAIVNGSGVPRATVDSWTERVGTSLFVPRIDWQGAGLRDDPDQYEITVKLFLLQGASVAQRESHIKTALELVRKELGIETIDLLIIAYPGVSFEGNCEWEADKINAQQGDIDVEIETWRVLEELHRQGLVKRLGVSEFGSEKLRAFIDRTSIHPTVDQINLRNCCNVPPPLKKIAVETGIELNVHTDCTDILPQGTLRELLGPHGIGLLADSNATKAGDGLAGEITPQWVVRYLAFVRDRGVIENKGYFAGADLSDN
ncbi:NADP-dependent oxidoreductase domain-containing protein [Stachybotrys elegans]|uniref:GCS light chain n=1 Tax=Stachybotrys elegans TaxID=80388 RepID=A0A8K0WW86_9HYPO|nr:NADP-dependent oxidoreductase domain-containing protein [Stachybotrys elegans]